MVLTGNINMSLIYANFSTKKKIIVQGFAQNYPRSTP